MDYILQILGQIKR